MGVEWNGMEWNGMKCAKGNSEAQVLKQFKFSEVCSGAEAKEDTTIFHPRTNDGFVTEEEGGRVTKKI